MIFGRKPKFETRDEAMSDLSIMFHSFPNQPTFRADLLKPALLDYGFDSLAHVDDYLDVIRKDPNVENEFNRTVLRAGAYVGETIRRHSKKEKWHWVDYETAKSIDPEGWKNFEKSISSCAVLYQGGASFCFPIGKVAKFLENGREDSVKFFAECIVDMWNKKPAEPIAAANRRPVPGQR